MKKAFFTCILLIICHCAFSQVKQINKMSPEEYSIYMYGVQIEDYVKNNTVAFYASPNEKTITVKFKNSDKKEIYKFGTLPEKYYHFIDENGYYSHRKFVLCLYNGKYGIINKNGDIIENFKWDASRFIIYCNDESVSIYDKEKKLVCSILYPERKIFSPNEKYLNVISN